MKKTNFKINKTKLIARIMLLVLLLTSTLTLTACPGNSQRELYFRIYSYDEMFEYATMHKQTFPFDDCFFWMFNLNKYDNITLKYYFVEILWHAEGWDYFMPPKEDRIPSDHFNVDNACEYTMNMVLEEGNVITDAYTIKCYSEYWSKDDILNNPSGIIRNTINGNDSMANEGYISEYCVLLKDNIGIKFYISHEHEATQEELDAIVQIFIDNAVIIK